MSASPLIIYHAHCADGFTAAWAADRYCRHILGLEAELLPAHYGDPPPDVTGRRVYVVDFSYPREEMTAMHAAAASLRVFDHHHTAAERLEGLEFAVFDMTRSGAGLTWDTLFGPRGGLRGDARPLLVDYVEDRDLWRWTLPDSREINALIGSFEHSLAAWNALHLRLGDRESGFPVQSVYPGPLSARDILRAEGEAILRSQSRTVRQHVERATWVDFHDTLVPAINATTLISEIGNELARNAAFALIWFENHKGEISYSLRSSSKSPICADVSEIAQAYGGGGHRHAAGFSSPTFVHSHVKPRST